MTAINQANDILEFDNQIFENPAPYADYFIKTYEDEKRLNPNTIGTYLALKEKYAKHRAKFKKLGTEQAAMSLVHFYLGMQTFKQIHGFRYISLHVFVQEIDLAEADQENTNNNTLTAGF